MNEELIAVLAHGMMSSMTVVRLAVDILRRENIHDALRADVASDAADHIELIVDVLGGLVRGLPAEALCLLQPGGDQSRSAAGVGGPRASVA